MISKLYLGVVNPPTDATGWSPFWRVEGGVWYRFVGWTGDPPGIPLTTVAEFNDIPSGPGRFGTYFWRPEVGWGGYYLTEEVTPGEGETWVWDFATGELSTGDGVTPPPVSPTTEVMTAMVMMMTMMMMVGMMRSISEGAR